MENRRFNRLEKNGQHRYIEQLGGEIRDAVHDGYLKCKLVHTRGKSLIVPDQVFTGTPDALKWYQPLSILVTTIVNTTCALGLDISCGQSLIIKFSPEDFIREYDDCSHLYKCKIQGPADLETYATGDAAINSDHEIFLKLFHHTSLSTAEKIEGSKSIWGSQWNIQGTTKKLINVRYVYFTPLDKISNDADLNQIGMGGIPTGKIGVRRIDGSALKLDVYRDNFDNRQHAVVQWVNAAHLAPQHVMFYDELRAYYVVVSPFIHRVGLNTGRVYAFENGYFTGDSADIKHVKYLIIGNAATDEGLEAPYDEENTSQIFKTESTDGKDFICFWFAKANKDLYSCRNVEMHQFETVASTTATATTANPPEDLVALRAFAIWIATGLSHGHDKRDWYQAETCLPAELEQQDPNDMPAVKRKELGHWHQWHYDRNDWLTVIAPHGGNIEPLTSLIAENIAGLEHNLFVFAGFASTRTYERLHITSSRYRDANLTRLQKKSRACLSIHGRRDARDGEEVTWVGGQNNRLRESVTRALGAAQFDAQDAVAQRLIGYEGIDDNNFVNMCTAEKGVQLELSRSLREKLFANQSKLRRYTDAIRSVLIS